MNEILEETGEVVEINGDLAKVLLHRNTSCDKCGACRMGGKPQIVIEVTNNINAKKGDVVILQMQPGFLFKAVFLMYTIPLLMLIIGFLVGQRVALNLGNKIDTSENVGIFSGFFFLAMSYSAIRWLDQKWHVGNKFRPVLVGVIPNQNHFSDDRQK